MERKYYLRGLGIGIVMTAVIMGIALSGSHKMTDQEIIARAKELGMVEDTHLADWDASVEQIQKGQNIEKPDAGGREELAAAEPESPPAAEESLPEAAEPVEVEDEPLETAGPVKTEPEKDTNEMTRQEDTGSSSAKAERVTIVGGDGSYTVALKLKEAGVVISAETFDTFLCEKGYDKKLRTGTFEIPADASDEQIARILTGQE